MSTDFIRKTATTLVSVFSLVTGINDAQAAEAVPATSATLSAQPWSETALYKARLNVVQTTHDENVAVARMNADNGIEACHAKAEKDLKGGTIARVTDNAIASMKDKALSLVSDDKALKSVDQACVDVQESKFSLTKAQQDKDIGVQKARVENDFTRMFARGNPLEIGQNDATQKPWMTDPLYDAAVKNQMALKEQGLTNSDKQQDREMERCNKLLKSPHSTAAALACETNVKAQRHLRDETLQSQFTQRVIDTDNRAFDGYLRDHKAQGKDCRPATDEARKNKTYVTSKVITACNIK